MTTEPVIEVTGLRKSYGGKPVVDDISFAVEEGEIFGILGPNGAGKTTTVECVEGLRIPDGGRVRVTGLDPVADHEAVTRVLGAQLQESELQAKLTVREALELYAAFYPSPADWRPWPNASLAYRRTARNVHSSTSGAQVASYSVDSSCRAVADRTGRATWAKVARYPPYAGRSAIERRCSGLNGLGVLPPLPRVT
jgi:ABC-type branched-subunit amino acid transport system ATPase component